MGASTPSHLVIAAADIAGELGDLVCDLPLQNRDGTPRADPGRPILARNKVRHIGEPVAFVVAETLEQAKDASERIGVAYDALPVVVESMAAAVPGAPQLFDDVADNLCFDWEYGDAEEMERMLDGAAHVTRLTFAIERLAMSPIEPRAAIGVWDADAKRHVLHATTQSADYVRRHLAEYVFKIDPAGIRVLTPDVGGPSASNTAPTPSTPWCCTRRGALNGPCAGPASDPRHSFPMPRRATTPSTALSPWTMTEKYWGSISRRQ